MSSQHILEFPNEVTPEQLNAVLEALGLPLDRCEWVTLRATGYDARVAVSTLTGQIVGSADIHVVCVPGKERGTA